MPTGSYKRTVALQSGLPLWLSDREPTSQCRRRGFDPWVRKIPWRRKWQLAPVFLPGESNGQRSLAAIHGSQRVERGLVIKQQQPICGSKITRGFCLLFRFFMMSHRMKFQGTAFPYWLCSVSFSNLYEFPGVKRHESHNRKSANLASILFSSVRPLVLDKERTPPEHSSALCTCMGFSQYESSDVAA